VKEAMKNNVWLELEFDKTIEYNQMPFDTILIEVNSEYAGFNLMRGNKGEYDGRCYYVDLDGNMSKLYDFVVNE
jgi:hypothetical protein